MLEHALYLIKCGVQKGISPVGCISGGPSRLVVEGHDWLSVYGEEKIRESLDEKMEVRDDVGNDVILKLIEESICGNRVGRGSPRATRQHLSSVARARHNPPKSFNPTNPNQTDRFGLIF